MLLSLKKEIFALPIWMVVVLFWASILSQLGTFGHPLVFVDQEYYLYAGGMMLQGGIPYVDFWDRKPYGLFLLFEFFHLFGSWRFFVVPLFSSLFAWVGALSATRISRWFYPCFGNVLAGLFLTIAIPAFGVMGGQTEGFYMPLVLFAMSVFITNYQLISKSSGKLFKTGCVCMIIFGIALEIKPSCLWEGMLLGLALLYVLFIEQQNLDFRTKLLRAVWYSGTWILLALIPTLIIVAWYIHHGYWSDWYFSNVTSYGLKPFILEGGKNLEHLRKRLFELLGFLIFVGTLSFIGGTRVPREKHRMYVFVWLWAIVATASALCIKGWFAYPMVGAAGVYGVLFSLLWNRRLIKVVAIFSLCLFTVRAIRSELHINKPKSDLNIRQQYKVLGKYLEQQPGCLWGYATLLVLYEASEATASCHLTKWSFPPHLSDRSEFNAVGTDVYEETMRLLSLHPLYIASDPNQKHDLPEQRNIVQKVIERDYIPMYVIDAYSGNDSSSSTTIYKLKPGLIPGVAPKGYEGLPSKPFRTVQ